MTGDVIAIIEPGTPAGFQRILVDRQTLIDQGAHIRPPAPMRPPVL